MKIKGLDYIRVFGIFLVIIYHFFPHVLSGGFLGVNILFVLSGFLISYHLIDEIYDTHKIDYKNYYFKRYVRIVPGLLLMLFVTSLFALGINKDYTVNYFDQFVSSFSFMSNYYEILTGGSYEAKFIDHLFLHTWSLAIEVHFYLLWPLFISLVYKKTSKNRPSKKKFSSYYMYICLIAYSICYFLTIILAFVESVDISFVYFFDVTRMSSFFLGSLLAAFVKRFSYRKIPYNKPTIISSLVIIGLSLVLSYEGKATYVLGFILTDILTGFLILIAYSNPKLAEYETMIKASSYSYGVYLFHWPLFVIFKSLMGPRLAMIFTILVGGGLVLFNHHVFEPLFVGKRENLVTKNISPRTFNISLSAMVFLSFVLSIGLSNASGNLVSLERDILVESISQDIDKIERDKKDLDKALVIENSANGIPDSVVLTDEDYNNPSIIMLGDSVILGPRGYFEENIPNLFINAEGSRLLEEAPSIINDLNNQGNLGDIVILELGTNAEKDPKISLKQIVDEFPEGKKLILITCFDNRFDQPHRVSKAMNNIAAKYDYITLMPWEKVAIENPNYYEGTDGVHFYGKQDVYEAYLSMLKDAIDQAMTKPSKGE